MEVRTLEQRKRDVLAKLDSEVDLWVASADESGSAYLVPLSFAWDGNSILMATPESSRTARNLRRAGWARVAIGPTRDVVVIEGPVDWFPANLDSTLAEFHASRAGFDARAADPPYQFLNIRPERIQAWRNPAELPGRYVMRDSTWLA